MLEFQPEDVDHLVDHFWIVVKCNPWTFVTVVLLSIFNLVALVEFVSLYA